MKRRDAFSFFANPFVVLADIMVCLAFIIALFLLATTVYSEETERYLELQNRRTQLATSLTGQLRSRGFSWAKTDITSDKYRIGDVLEVENDASLQRIRFLGGKLDFLPGQAQFAAPDGSRRLLAVLGAVLLQNRSNIKSIVIEGQAARDEANPWMLSQERAETVRRLWAQMELLGDVDREKALPCIAFLKGAGAWNPLFGSWHREEYQARRVAAPTKNGVIPQAWIITAGRGDQMRRQSVVEFKVEYTLNSPLDDVLDTLPTQLRERAVAQNLILKPRPATSRRQASR